MAAGAVCVHIQCNRLQEQPRPSIWGEINFINGSPDPLPENFIDGSPDPLPENFHRCFPRPAAGSSISIDCSPDPLGKQIIDAPFAPRAQRTLAKFDFCRAGTFHICLVLCALKCTGSVCVCVFLVLCAPKCTGSSMALPTRCRKNLSRSSAFVPLFGSLLVPPLWDSTCVPFYWAWQRVDDTHKS